MRAIGVILLAVAALGAHCPETPWEYEPIPDQGPRSEVFLDSGAVVKAHLRDGEVVTGSLLVSFAPGGDELIVCEESAAPCSRREGTAARSVPLTAIERLEFPNSHAGHGAELGFRLSGLAVLSQYDEDEDEEFPTAWFLLGSFAGGGVGALIGSLFTDWITVAERSDAGTLLWIPKVPELIPLPSSRHEFATACARGNALPNGDLVAVVDWEQSAYFTDVLRAWEVDTVGHRMIPTRTDDVRCRNEVWEGPVTAVPYDVESGALTFTAAPGKARVYVYQVVGHYRDKHVSFEVTVDDIAIGRTVPGTYLVADVEPGLHRLKNRETRHDVLLGAAADSVYFLKIWHERGFWKPDYGHVARVDPVEGRTLIWTGRMLSSTSPGATQGPYQDVRVIGLVEVPGLFGTRDPDGPPGLVSPATIGSIPLHVLPSADSRVIGTATAPGDLEAREHDYEALAAVVYEVRDSSYLVRFRMASGFSLGWLTPPHAGAFHPLGELVRGGLAYLTEEWDGRLFASPGDTIASTKLEPSDELRDIVVKDVKEIEGALWLEIEVLAPGRCETGQVRPTVWGWVRAHAPDGKPNAWLYSRGC